jgi:predicted dehydrogenase
LAAHRIALLGTGLIATFYAQSLHAHRGRDRVGVVYSRDGEKARRFAADWGVDRSTSDMADAIEDADADVVVIGLPNDLHEEAVERAARAGKAVLCTKPLGRDAAEAHRMLEAVERAGVFHGYLEDLAYTPKTLKTLRSIEQGALGRVTWARSREAHAGPHSAWFWDPQQAGGGALVDLGCHCIEIGRNFVGKHDRPVEAMCWTDTLYHPVPEAEDNAVGLVRYSSGAVAQFEVSWSFHGGMDLRDEVAGTEGTVWLNHFLRTGFEMFSTGGGGGYVAEKAESETGWLFPVGDESSALGYPDMFTDMFEAMDCGDAPMESFYDGCVVNAIMDACYRSARSRRWEPVELPVWRGAEAAAPLQPSAAQDGGRQLVKRERMPDGREKRILRDPTDGSFHEEIEE